MLIQPKNESKPIPDLDVNGVAVSKVNNIVYLGDVFNDKGNNDALMDDRVKRGTATTVSIHGFMREVSLGFHTISVYLLLHNSILIPSVLFNSQAWSGITDKNISTISTIQIRYLKKMLEVRQSTANAFLYLELGVLPIKFELHKRQMSFLHHIVNLTEEDPVKKVWRNQMNLPEHRNWWRDVEKLFVKYGLEFDEEGMVSMSKETYKKRVKMAVAKKALEELLDENKGKKRTANWEYEKLETQKYIRNLDPASARIIFKCRAKTLNIKSHMKFKYKEDLSCRWCGICEESLEHIVNCGQNTHISEVDKSLQEMETEKLKEIAVRTREFLWKVEV